MYERPQIQEDTPENRYKTAGRVFTFLEKTDAGALLKDPETKREWIQNLTPEDFESLLERLNGIITDTPLNKREMYDNFNVTLVDEEDKTAWVPPHWSIAKKIFREYIIPEIKNLNDEDMGEVLATEINLLHTFPDGNGRLSRLCHLLLSNKVQSFEPEHRREVLEWSLTKRKGAIDWNPQRIQNELFKLVEVKIKKDSVLKNVSDFNGVPDDDSDFYKLDDMLGRITISASFVKDKRDTLLGAIAYTINEREKPEEYLPQGTAGDILDTKRLLNEFKEEDINKFLNYYHTVKALQAVELLMIYKKPDDYPSPIENLNLKQYYRYCVSAKQRLDMKELEKEDGTV